MKKSKKPIRKANKDKKKKKIIGDIELLKCSKCGKENFMVINDNGNQLCMRCINV